MRLHVHVALVGMTVATGLSMLSACSSTAPKAGSSDPAVMASTAATRGGNSAPADQRTVSVLLTAQGCKPEHDSYASGPLTFDVRNTDATGVTEFEVLSKDRILGEKENVAPGFGGTFSLQLQPGSYTLYCPGATTQKTALVVTGEASATTNSSTETLLKAGAKGYLTYVRGQVTSLSEDVAKLDAAIRSGNLTAAQKAYIIARAPYERIEPVVESFPTLDSVIDARADDKPVTTLTGFHRIEYGLFSKRSVAGLAPVSAGLITNVAKLEQLVKALAGFQPAELANGAVGLLEEAAKTKITGEEERYSHIDLVDLSANVEGSQQAFAYLEDGLSQIDTAFVAQIKVAFTRVTAQLKTLKDPASPSGYKSYPQLTRTQIAATSSALQAVHDQLSRVAGKVVSA